MADGTQTLNRALSLLEAAAEIHELDRLAESIEVSRSTAYRLLTALAERGYLRHEPRVGYFLGLRLLQLGFRVYEELHLPSIARPHLERLSEFTQETIHLALLDNDHGVYIDKVQGSRHLQMASKIGAEIHLQCTALGKILVSGFPEDRWLDFFSPDLNRTENTITALDEFLIEIRRTKEQGYALDMEENEVGIRCIAAPIHDGRRNIVAAISLAGATVYLDEPRLEELVPLVKKTAESISENLGWSR